MAAPREDPAREAKTLGDILYANKPKTLVSEGEWLRLVRSVAAGDQRALQELYERAHRIVFTLIVRIINNRESAEEVTVDVFHGIWCRAASYDPADGSVIGWIMTQARSRAIDRLRFEQRKKRVMEKGEIAPATGQPSDPGGVFDVHEQAESVRDALITLTPLERQAIETAFFSEMTYQETAARLQIPVGTIKTRIRVGLEKLRQRLGRKEL